MPPTPWFKIAYVFRQDFGATNAIYPLDPMVVPPILRLVKLRLYCRDTGVILAQRPVLVSEPVAIELNRLVDWSANTWNYGRESQTKILDFLDRATIESIDSRTAVHGVCSPIAPADTIVT